MTGTKIQAGDLLKAVWGWGGVNGTHPHSDLDIREDKQQKINVMQTLQPDIRCQELSSVSQTHTLP